MENNVNPNEEIKKNYDLKSKAVEELVDGEVPEYSQEELERYRKKSRLKVPEVLKILLIKTWFAGAVCFFIVWGLSMYIPGAVERFFVLAVAMGMVVDLLLNNVLRFLEKTPGANDRWLFVTHRGIVGFGLNLLYGFIVTGCVYAVYEGVNRLAIQITGNADKIYLGVEPILFGLLCMGFDTLFIAMKHLLQQIVRDAMDSAKTR